MSVHWWQRLAQRLMQRGARRGQPRRRCRLFLEPLEDRLAPATFTVVGTGDSGSGSGTTGDLLYCINQANAQGGANTIVFAPALAGATIDLSNFSTGTAFTIDPNSTLTIDGGASGITLDAQDRGRFFYVDPGANLTLDELWLRNGIVQGPAGGNGTGNLSHPSGGGGGGALGAGGAIFNAGTLTMLNCTLSGNTALGGNGGNSFQAKGAGNAGGNGGNDGGGYYGGYGGVPSFYGSQSTSYDGGNGGVKRGFGGGGGGGNEEDIISDSGFGGSGGSGGYGGGAGGNGGNGKFFYNGGGGGGAGMGGAIFNTGNLTITNSTLASNTASGGAGGQAQFHNGQNGANGAGLGGAIFNHGGGVQLNNDTLAGNSANSDGGGIANSGTLTVTNSTISGNSASADGGGIYNNGALTVSNSTIFGNIGGTINIIVFGGGLYSSSTSPPPLLENTIVAGNVSGFGLNQIPDDIVGAVSSNSVSNLIGVGAGLTGISNGSNGNLIGSRTAPIDPKLAPLGDYGGPTQTMALLPGSPAIDAGDSNAPGLPATDQRGYSRIVGDAIDIGAVEYQYDLAVSGTAPSSVQTGQTIAYTLTVTNNGPDTAGNGGGVVLSDVLPSGVAFVSLQTPMGWTSSENNGTVQASIATLASGASAAFTLVVQTSSNTPSNVANTVTIGPTTWDTQASNNSVTFNTANTAVAPMVVSFNVLFGSESYNLIGSTRYDLPWAITGIQVVFSESIDSGDINSLTGLSATGFSGLGTNTLTWTFNPITLGSFATTLRGSGSDALKDAAGNPLAGGAGFVQNFKVLEGDVNDDGVVDSADLVTVYNATKQPYNLFADINGDGAVTLADVELVRSLIGNHLS